jgi:hypothetical protein
LEEGRGRRWERRLTNRELALFINEPVQVEKVISEKLFFKNKNDGSNM